MAINQIVQEPHKILRAQAKEISSEEISSKEIKNLIRDMSDTLRSIDVGIGLAAPQVGRSLRLFLISEEAKSEKKEDEFGKKEYETEHKKAKHLIFINPRLVKISKKRNIVPEGCLSVNDPKGQIIYGKIARAEKITAEAYDENGKKFKIGAKGLFAQAIQHELDHLDGILFIDRALEIHKVTREDVEKHRRKQP